MAFSFEKVAKTTILILENLLKKKKRSTKIEIWDTVFWFNTLLYNKFHRKWEVLRLKIKCNFISKEIYAKVAQNTRYLLIKV